MTTTLTAVTHADLDDLLPLIRGYQTFYEAEHIDDEKNRAFFGGLIGHPEHGIQHLLRVDGKAAGFTTLYPFYASITAERIMVLYDLYLDPAHRGAGHARRMMQNAADYVREQGLPAMTWNTAPDNHTAQRLYDSLPATRSTWFEYEWRF